MRSPGALVAVLAMVLMVPLAVAATLLRPSATGAHLDETPLLVAAQAAPAEAAPVIAATDGQPSSQAQRDLPPSRDAGGVGPVGRLGVSEDWVKRIAARTGIPIPAIRAYGAASLRLAKTNKSCHLGWTTLAGIGTIESGNGTGGGRTLNDAGFSSTPIVGPALDGAGFAAIHAPDGDWDHAWGPMQFITSTWTRWAADGDGDGTADINNIYDAAVAAGNYLCANGRDLATPEGWTEAVLSYNHSDDYLQSVYAAANSAGR